MGIERAHIQPGCSVCGRVGCSWFICGTVWIDEALRWPRASGRRGRPRKSSRRYARRARASRVEGGRGGGLSAERDAARLHVSRICRQQVDQRSGKGTAAGDVVDDGVGGVSDVRIDARMRVLLSSRVSVIRGHPGLSLGCCRHDSVGPRKSARGHWAPSREEIRRKKYPVLPRLPVARPCADRPGSARDPPRGGTDAAAADLAASGPGGDAAFR